MLEVTRNAHTDFYPRSPCGERQVVRQSDGQSGYISIHALLAESDTLIWDVIAVMTISIHALLAESDDMAVSYSKGIKISIHALLAESDRQAGQQQQHHNEFLSTLSLRRATPTG